MTKYRVPFNGFASATVDVVTDETDPQAIVQLAHEEGVPTICAQCGGWGQDWSLDIDDQWEVATDEEGKPDIYTLDD